eukprot:9443735-Pyramimonas_sp.AAC.1
MCRLRRLHVGGRKARDHARRLELLGFTPLQARCIQGPLEPLGHGPEGFSLIYQGSQGPHIGQGALVRGASALSGGVGRLRENFRGFRSLSQGAPVKERSMYFRLAPGRQQWPPMFFVALYAYVPIMRMH